MDLTLQIVLIIGVACYFAFLLALLRKRTFSLKYILLWLFAGVVMLFCALFPKAVSFITGLLGISTTSNAVFALVLFFVLINLISMTSTLSKLAENCRRLTQTNALLEKRVAQLEQKLQDGANG